MWGQRRPGALGVGSRRGRLSAGGCRQCIDLEHQHEQRGHRNGKALELGLAHPPLPPSKCVWRPSGAASLGTVTLGVSAQDLVTGITRKAERGMSITYTLSATVTAGMVSATMLRLADGSSPHLIRRAYFGEAIRNAGAPGIRLRLLAAHGAATPLLRLWMTARHSWPCFAAPPDLA